MNPLTLFDIPAAKEPTGHQNKRILEYLRVRGGITRQEAMDELQCWNLPARILELKALGWPIDRADIPKKHSKGTTGVYVLRSYKEAS